MNRFLVAVMLLASAYVCHAQNVRVDIPWPSVSSSNPPFLVANLAPNSPVLSVCASPANQVPCTNRVTTYTSAGVACPAGAQDTPQPQPSACQATGDGQGNIGFWIPAGKYDITVCVNNNCGNSPYTISVGGATGGNIIQINGVTLASGDTVNFNNTSPTAPSNGTNVQFQTTHSGTVDSVSAAIVGNGNAGQCLSGAGTYVACSGGGGGGGVSGSGTAGVVPLWATSTSLGNSALSDNGTNKITSTEEIVINTSSPNGGLVTNGGSIDAVNNNSTSCGGSGFNNICFGSRGAISTVPTNSTGSLVGIVGLANIPSATFTGSPTIIGVSSNALYPGTGAVSWLAGVVGQTTSSGSGAVAVNSGLVASQFTNGEANTIQDGVDSQVSAQSATVTNAIGVYVRSPLLFGGGVLTNNYGIKIDDQTVAGSGTNSHPFSIYSAGNGPNVFQGHVNQVATGNWAGTCVFSGGTTCSITYNSAGINYSSIPVVILTPVNPGSVTFTLTSTSNSGFTITGSSANSSTVNWVAIGNPN